jgi:hypothetical protein
MSPLEVVTFVLYGLAISLSFFSGLRGSFTTVICTVLPAFVAARMRKGGGGDRSMMLLVHLKVGTNENGSACGRWLLIGI